MTPKLRVYIFILETLLICLATEAWMMCWLWDLLHNIAITSLRKAFVAERHLVGSKKIHNVRQRSRGTVGDTILFPEHHAFLWNAIKILSVIYLSNVPLEQKPFKLKNIVLQNYIISSHRVL